MSTVLQSLSFFEEYPPCDEVKAVASFTIDENLINAARMVATARIIPYTTLYASYVSSLERASVALALEILKMKAISEMRASLLLHGSGGSKLTVPGGKKRIVQKTVIGLAKQAVLSVARSKAVITEEQARKEEEENDEKEILQAVYNSPVYSIREIRTIATWLCIGYNHGAEPKTRADAIRAVVIELATRIVGTNVDALASRISDKQDGLETADAESAAGDDSSSDDEDAAGGDGGGGGGASSSDD